MDPLSVAGAMVGILVAAGKVAGIVHHIVSSAKDAPKVATSIYSEVKTVRTILSSLQRLLPNLESAPPDRPALIHLDQLIATFMDGVLIFSELEALLGPLELPAGVKFQRKGHLHLASRKKDILDLLGRLQRYNISISLMLNILQCDSARVAAQHQQELSRQVTKLLESNEALSRKFRDSESFDVCSMLREQTDNLSITRADGDDETITLARTHGSEIDTTVLETSLVRFEFQDDLESSRVYRRAKRDTCDHSFTSSTGRTNAWSIFSGLSIADISNISAIALPLYAPDITNSQHYAFCGTHAANSKGQSPHLGGEKETTRSHIDVKLSEPTADVLPKPTQGEVQLQPYKSVPGSGSAPRSQDNRTKAKSLDGRDGLPEANGVWLLPPIKPEFKDKKCLVLDLDETLVHSSFKILERADFTFPIEIEGQYHNMYVLKRPGVDQFMKRVGMLYEIVLFGGEVKKYLDLVVDQLDIYHVVQHRLCDDSCYNHYNNFIKDLSQLGRDLRNVIIIDNSPESYIFHPQNAVPISSWFSDRHDNELLDLIPLLEDLASQQVRDVTLVLDVGL